MEKENQIQNPLYVYKKIEKIVTLIRCFFKLKHRMIRV